MNVLTRKQYYWKNFLMTWLVPNYRRAKGPAWWVFKAKWWWSEEMTTDYCGSFLNNVIDKLDSWRKKCTPWLKNAREFIDYCCGMTETKLLSCKSTYIYVRTRGEHTKYFMVKTDLFGNVTIDRIIFRDEKGKLANAFIAGFCGHELKREVKRIWESTILTKNQLKEAKKDVLKFEDMSWITEWIKLEDFIDKWLPVIDAEMLEQRSKVGSCVEDLLEPKTNDEDYDARMKRIEKKLDEIDMKTALLTVKEAVKKVKENL